MGIRSNICIRSNIYVRKEIMFHRDKNFIKNIRGHEALSKAKKHIGSFDFNVLLTPSQRREYEQSSGCSYAKDGEKPFGIIIEDDMPVFVCKCENFNCPNRAECASCPDSREMPPRSDTGLMCPAEYEEEEREEYIPPKFSFSPRQLRVDEENRINAVSDEITIEEVAATTATAEEATSIKTSTGLSISQPIPDEISLEPTKHTEISSSLRIITAPLEERIIVNAGPGTGKTYTVIKRLGYIANNELADLRNVVVLCFSRSAVGVIRDRIREEIRRGHMVPEAALLFNGIRTFDSFATYLLSDDNLQGTINYLDYDERIERFIVELRKDPSVFDGMEYLVVDEMQDLVGVRARMVREILEHLQCGFLLLGDRCQSIYDYQIQDDSQLNSYRYYQWLDKRFGDEVNRFELTRNMRQSPGLAELNGDIRKAILSEEVEHQRAALERCINVLQDKYGVLSEEDIDYRDLPAAVLCRNNAKAAKVSTHLFETGAAHQIVKGAQHVDLVPWIAQVLSTYTENRIGLTAFKERVADAGLEDPEDKWDLLKTIASDGDPRVLDVELLVRKLVEGVELPPEVDLVRLTDDVPIVSTIHRSKGREYAHVALLSQDFNTDEITLDETKVAYVALTRGKERVSFFKIDPFYGKKLNSGRWIGTGRSRKGNFYCKNFVLGLSGDVDPYSFVEDIFEGAKARQNYISQLMPGDPLEIHFIDGVLGIFHQGYYVGRLSHHMFDELRDAMRKTNNSRNLPNRMTDVYVNNVITIANTRYSERVVQPYNKSGLWLGLEISGFAKTYWP